MRRALGLGLRFLPFLIFAIIATFLFAHSAFAESRIAEQVIATTTVDQEAFGLNNYPAQSFTATSTGIVQSIAVADNGCGVVISDGAFSFSNFPTRTSINGGSRYTGASFSVSAGGLYYLTTGCNNNPGNFGGSTSDLYAGGEAGHMKQPGVFQTQFVSNATAGNRLLDWAFTVCTSSDCTLAGPQIDATTTAPVIIIPGILGSAPHNGVWLIDPITHAYDNLIDTLIGNGFENDKTLFTFPYDWHKSNIDTAVLLKAKIDEVKAVCNCAQVDIVAHSMGGLVARQYIQSDYYGHDVRKLIFLGTPQLGAPKAYLMWEGGENDTDKADQRLKAFLRIEAIKHGYTNLFDYIRARPIPSVQELLPVYGYIKHLGSPDIPTYPNTAWYPSNTFLENLDNNISNLYSAGVDITNFVGDLTNSTTITTLRVVPPSTISSTAIWGYGFPENFGNSSTDQGLERGVGDGTVPLSSASFVPNHLLVFNSEHTELVTNAQGSVFKVLTDKDPVSLVTDQSGLDVKMLIIQILSPADIKIIAPDGKEIGKDFATGQEITANKIPDAFYSGFGTDDEYVTIPSPLDGEYKVVTQGTGGGGTYTIATGVIADATSSTTFFTGQTAPGQIIEQDVHIDASSPSDTTITPADVTPPTITIIQPATTTFTHGSLMPVKVAFSDATGVATSSVSFNGKPITASTTIDLFFELAGNGSLVAYARDFVNNATSSARVIQVIATFTSTRNDINRENTLGWISKSLKSQLTGDLIKASTARKSGDRIKYLNAMQKDLNTAKSGGKITLLGYQILTADVNWLLNH
ncbi:hypothetical protein HY968_00920 [Candidatus Kaiserbacteria bacterium]|nr:hypothetical protein [Candidatus Kaiserbacteria bacterium]